MCVLPTSHLHARLIIVLNSGILVLCVVYWYIWTHLLPYWRGYHLEERTFVLEDGAVTKTLVKVWNRKDSPALVDEDSSSQVDKKQSEDEHIKPQ